MTNNTDDIEQLLSLLDNQESKLSCLRDDLETFRVYLETNLGFPNEIALRMVNSSLEFITDGEK